MEDEAFVIHTEVCRKLPLLRDTLPLLMFTTKSRIKKPISTEEMVCVYMNNKYQANTLTLFIEALAIAHVETSAVLAASGCLPAHEI